MEKAVVENVMKSSTNRHSHATPITWNLPEWSIPFLEPARFKSVKGCRGSSKSHTLAQLAVMRMANMLPGYPPGPVRNSRRHYHLLLAITLDQSCQ